MAITHTHPSTAPPAGTIPHPAELDVADRETAPLNPAVAIRLDSLAVLDHRSRRRVIPARLALPGHYIGLEDEHSEMHLLPVDAKVMHIGRATTADLRFEDAHVSRRHAIIVRYGRHVRVLDDRSAAGTFVNGLRVIATELSDGDVVRLGPVSFSYVVVR